MEWPSSAAAADATCWVNEHLRGTWVPVADLVELFPGVTQERPRLGGDQPGLSVPSALVRPN